MPRYFFDLVDDQTVFDPKHASHFNVFFSIGQTF